MIARLLVTLAMFAVPAFPQSRPLFQNPPKPKVIATPTPAPNPAPKPKSTAKRSTTSTTKRKGPTDEYVATVKAAFALRWVEAASPLLKDFNPGSVSVAFKLDAEGKLLEFQVTENSSNEAFAAFCEKFVRETPFDAPPAKALVDGQIEIPFTFKVY